MDDPILRISEPCPTCKFGQGKPFHVRIGQGTTTVTLRCDECGNEWRIHRPEIRETVVSLRGH